MEKKYLIIGGVAVLGVGFLYIHSDKSAAQAQTAQAQGIDSSPSMLYMPPAVSAGGTEQTDAANTSPDPSAASSALGGIGGTDTANNADIVSLLSQQIQGQNANQALALNLQAQTNDLAI